MVHWNFIPARLLPTALLLLLMAMDAAFAGGRGEDFLAAREAYRVHDLTRLDALAKRLEGQPLEPYSAYWLLQAQLGQAEPDKIRQFLERYSDSPLVHLLRADWLKTLGRQQQWQAFLNEYPKLLSPDPVLTCYALQAQFSQGDDGALAEARPLWFTAGETPSSCTPLFEALLASGSLSAEDVWTRLRLALEAGNIAGAKGTSLHLPASEAAALQALNAVQETPQRFLEQGKFDLNNRAERELVIFALQRAARSDPQLAHGHWLRLQERFSGREQGYVWGQLALHAARRHDPAALEWYRKAGDAALSDLQLEWRARAALREQDWAEVLLAIQGLSEAAQQQDTWRYWKGRALKATGKTAQANGIFAPLSREHSFYGQLAGEEMGEVMGVPSVGYQPGETEIAAIGELPGIRRALALYQLNLRLEATREWVWAIRAFDDRQLLAAAELARRLEWYDRAINTADKTVALHDFSLRYPTPHREIMGSHAGPLQLDETWVYGLIRQESRFVPQARSSAGAAGVMQLMPATARWAAKRLGLKDFRQSAVSQLDKNIALGTYYLKYVLDTQDGHPVLATAAYNAGPVRARRWRADRAMEGAIYAESIPFGETRDYVKKVMSNATYYANSLGLQLLPLKQRLGMIAGGGREGCREQDERSPSCEP